MKSAKNSKNKNMNHIELKNLLYRYSSTFILILIFQTKIFAYTIAYIFTWIAYFFLQLFSNVELQIETLTLIINSKETFLIINECIASSAYILIVIIILTLPLKYKKVMKMFFYTTIVFTICNLIRILFLMFVNIQYGVDAFNSIHLIFYKGISGVMVAIIIIYFLRKEKIKKQYPILSDMIWLIKEGKKKI